MEAVAGFPAGASFEVRVVVVFMIGPPPTPVTFTLREQFVFRLTFERLTVLPEAITVPPQVFVNPFGFATRSPDGNVSVNATPVKPAGFGLLREKVSVADSPALIPPGSVKAEKDFVRVGAKTLVNSNVPARKTFGGAPGGT